MGLFSGDKKEKKKVKKVKEKTTKTQDQSKEQKPKETIQRVSDEKLKNIPTDKNEKIKMLLEIMSNQHMRKIEPIVDFEQNQIRYPILEKIGVDPNDASLLEQISAGNSGIFKKETAERILVCPKHPTYFFNSIRLYCPHCYSLDVEKLNLIEHKVCGYIAEMKEFGVKYLEKIEQCPRCKRPINNYDKEIRIPGGWNHCNTCSQKFDTPIIKLHCRKEEHDFTLDEAENIMVPKYSINDESSGSFDKFALLSPLRKIMESLGFSVEELSAVKGKSGMMHEVSLSASNDKNQTIVVFIKTAAEVVDDDEVNSILVNVIDISPTKTIFIGIPAVSARAKTLADAHNITVITGNDVREIASSVENTLTREFSGQVSQPSDREIRKIN